jgi:hypothetical protein
MRNFKSKHEYLISSMELLNFNTSSNFLISKNEKNKRYVLKGINHSIRLNLIVN